MSTDYRTWGATRNCKGCRFWSEMVAGSGPNGMEAMCLAADSQFRNKFMPGYGICKAWRSGHHGAIDEPCPPEETSVARLYEIEETESGL